LSFIYNLSTERNGVKLKIVILDGYTENPGDLSWEGFEKLGELTVYDRTPADKIIERIGDADVVYTNKTPISRETLDACPNVKFIGVLATGYNVVDVEAAKEKGIPVSNIPTYGTDAVAQFTIALLLELCHHIGAHSDAVKNGEWTNNPDWCFWKYPLIELAGKTMGIIGFGRIGQRTAEIAQALGMKILAYDAYKNSALESEICKYAELDELLANSDVISLHCPLFPETQGIINKDTIAKMKDGVMILNTSRGPLIVEEDLRDALNSGKVAGAALDVVSKEPIEMNNPLLSAKNIIITPHIAWAPKESRQRLMDIAVDNLKAFISGNPQNVVNK
jgi:glycerate dehydrogenase